MFAVLFLESDKSLGLGGGEKSSEAGGGAVQWATQYITPSIQLTYKQNTLRDATTQNNNTPMQKMDCEQAEDDNGVRYS